MKDTGRGAAEMTDEDLLYRYDFLWSQDGFTREQADEVRELRTELLKRMSRGPVRGAREAAERIAAYVWHRRKSPYGQDFPDKLERIIADSLSQPAAPAGGADASLTEKQISKEARKAIKEFCKTLGKEK